MENVNGVFLVLFGGSIVASVYGFAEWCLNCYKRSRKTKVHITCFRLLKIKKNSALKINYR